MCRKYLLVVLCQLDLTFFLQERRLPEVSVLILEIEEGMDILGFRFKINKLASSKGDKLETLKKGLSSNFVFHIAN